MTHAWPDRMSGGEVFAYVRHRPEQTLLYQLIERHWPELKSHLSEAGSLLPRHVTREFEEYLSCGRLEHGFLRVRCEGCRHENLVAFSCKRRGFRLKRLLLVPQLRGEAHGGNRCAVGG